MSSSGLAERLTGAVDASMPLARRLFDGIGRRTFADPGFTRISYGEGEQLAHDMVAEEARALGLDCTTDVAGNLYITLPGRDRSLPPWISGSHLDTVPHGGNYDGAAGALAAVMGGAYRLTDGRHRLRLDRLTMAPE